MISSTIIVALLCILFSAFFSMSETSITGASKAIIYREALLEKKRAKILHNMLNSPNNLITSLLVGNNIANIFFTALITDWFIREFGEQNIFLLGLVLAVIVLIFAEILPKTYALTNPTKIALFLTPLVYGFLLLFKPVSYLFSKINQFILVFILRVKKSNKNNIFGSVDNLRGAIEMLNF